MMGMFVRSSGVWAGGGVDRGRWVGGARGVLEAMYGLDVGGLAPKCTFDFVDIAAGLGSAW